MTSVSGAPSSWPITLYVSEAVWPAWTLIVSFAGTMWAFDRTTPPDEASSPAVVASSPAVNVLASSTTPLPASFPSNASCAGAPQAPRAHAPAAKTETIKKMVERIQQR